MRTGRTQTLAKRDAQRITSMRLSLQQAEASVARAAKNLNDVRNEAVQQSEVMRFNERLDAIRSYYMTKGK